MYVDGSHTMQQSVQLPLLMHLQVLLEVAGLIVQEV